MSILVTLSVAGIIALALAVNTISSLATMKQTEVNYAASNLALSKIELLTTREVSDIDSSLDEVESNLTVTNLGIEFTRTTTVTVNADDTRTISVNVQSNHEKIPTSATFTTSLSLWE